MGKSYKAPPTPDYAAAAQQQGVANLEAARATAKLSNPNMITPTGTRTVSYEGDIPTITEALTPDAQKALEAQQRVDLGLSSLGEQALGTAQRVMGTPFEYQGPGIQTGLGDTGQIAKTPDLSQYGQAGANFGAQGVNYGPSAGMYGLAQGGVSGPNLQGSLDTSGLAKMPINAGTTAQEAIMSRLEPQLERQRAQRETQLANQGLVRGGEAYNAAMQEQGQQENDLRTQAALQGLNLDMSARQQGLGEQQALGQFANQAQLSGFGANIQNQQAYNQAVQQNMAMGLSAAQAQNQAAQQLYGQLMGVSEAQNQAIGQNQQAALQQQSAQNAAQAQQYNQALQAGQFGNTAAQQALQQQLALYNQPLNQISALMGGAQIQLPQFQAYQGANVAAAPIFQGTQAQDQANMQRYNAQQQSANALTSGLFGLGGSLIGAGGAAQGFGKLFS